MSDFRADLSEAVKAVREKGAKRILLQMPEGLKTKVTAFCRELEEKTGAEVLYLIDPCFGACDLPLDELKQFQAELIVHVGHNEFMKAGHTVYVPIEYDLDPGKFDAFAAKVAAEVKGRKAKKIGLLCTVNFKSYMERMRKILEKNGLEVLLEKGKRTVGGQLLGCDARAAESVEQESDLLVFVGDGIFHPIGVGFSSGKPLLLANPLSETIGEYGEKERDGFLRQRMGAVARAKNAKSFGILISSKLGQMRLGTARKMKALIEKHGRKAFLLAGDLLLEELLLGIQVDAFVSTACPRIAIDDGRHWKKPLLNPTELEVALGEKPMESLLVLEPQF